MYKTWFICIIYKKIITKFGSPFNTQFNLNITLYKAIITSLKNQECWYGHMEIYLKVQGRYVVELQHVGE
jgi:galactose-1-phosphate uridylyltransferase